MALYRDYIEIDEEFIPVFSDEVDRSNPKSWKTFIPHESFKNLLNALIKALDRASTSDKKPIWVTGAYGTGKTLGAFAIKHILEEDIEEISTYFDKYPLIQMLYERVKALKEGKKHLIVYKSSSSNINSTERLIIEVQQTIKRALEQKKYRYLGERTFYNNVLQKLADTESTFNFQSAFNKYRSEYFPEFTECEDVIRQLKLEDGKGSYSLTERVVRMMEKEGFIPSQSVEDLKFWIKNVISENQLNSIVFIWDEFTDYFRQNRAVSALQELAQLSSETPFYLFLITHRDIQQFSNIDDDARRVLEDRFIRVRFEMSDITTYYLMANAIKIKPNRKEEWKIKLETLWDSVEYCASQILESEVTGEAKKEDFKKLIPMHPSSCYLLHLLSSNFSSNQRTMFRFLRETEPNNFKQFIEENSIENRSLLTADVLWDYFFSDETQEIPERVLRAINYYNSHERDLTDNDYKKVFKGILLLITLSDTLGLSENSRRGKILRPFQTNLRYIYKGTNIERKIDSILERLCELKILNRVDRGYDAEFAIPIMSIDNERFEKLKKETEEKYSFENITKFENNEGVIRQKILEKYRLSGPLGARYILETSSIQNAERVINSWKNLEPYQVGVLFLLAKTEEDLSRIDSFIDKNKKGINVNKNEEDKRNIILINTNEAFSERSWNSFIDEKTRELYAHEMKDDTNSQHHAKRAERIIDEWLNKLFVTTMVACFKGESKEIKGMTDNLKTYLLGITKKLFQWGPEMISENENIYKLSGYSDDVIIMGMGESNSKRPYTEIERKLKDYGFWDNPESFKNRPEHPIAKAKMKIQELLDTDKPVSIAHIWEELSKPPFGYMPSPICAFLMGFLMRDYTKGNFYIDDGNASSPANSQRIAKAIEAVMKASRNYELYKIAKMKPEHVEFCKYMKGIFGLPDDSANSIRDVKSGLRRSLVDKGFPIWSLKYCPEEENTDKIAGVIRLLCDFVSATDDESSNDETQIAENIYKEFVLIGYKALSQLKGAMDINTLKRGLLFFIKDNCPSLYASARSLGIDDNQLLNDVKDYMSEDSSWLWQEEHFKEVVGSLETNYRLLQGFNRLIGTNFTLLGEAKGKIRERISELKIPLEVIKKYDEKSGRTLEHLYKYISERDYKFKEDLISELQYGIKALNDDKPLLADFIRDTLKSELTMEEVNEVYNNLNDVQLDMPLKKFEEMVKVNIDNLKTLNLKKMLVARWKEISNSESPEDWSEKNGIPVSWLPGLDDEKFLEIFDTLNNPMADSLKLQRVISTLEQDRDSFAVLTDKEKIKNAFIDSIAGDLAYLVDKEITLEAINTEIRKEFGNKVYNWRSKQKQISDHVRKFFEDEYNRRLYNKVLTEIEALSPEKAKSYLREIVQTEPSIGLRLLKNQS